MPTPIPAWASVESPEGEDELAAAVDEEDTTNVAVGEDEEVTDEVGAEVEDGVVEEEEEEENEACLMANFGLTACSPKLCAIDADESEGVPLLKRNAVFPSLQ